MISTTLGSMIDDGINLISSLLQDRRGGGGGAGAGEAGGSVSRGSSGML